MSARTERPPTERQRAERRAAKSSRGAIRNAALEEAAALIDRQREKFEGDVTTLYQRNVCWNLAHDIRALKGKP